MKYSPKRSNHIADAVFTMCFISAVILYASSGAATPYKSAVRLLSLMLLTVGLYIMIRYRLLGYNYIIRAKNIDETAYSGISALDFIIEKIQGNRRNTECRLSMDELTEIKRLPQKSGEKREIIKEYGYNLKIYNYTVTMYPPNPYLIIFHDTSDPSGDSKIGVIFEPDKTMADYITGICRALNKNENKTAETDVNNEYEGDNEE